MSRSPRFTYLVALQLCIPAVVYMLTGLYSGRTSGIEYLPLSYLYMALPHLLVAVHAICFRGRDKAVLLLLSALNVSLIAFQTWVLSLTPKNEAGLAWFLYIPLWAVVLIVGSLALAAWDRGAKSRHTD